FKPSPLSPQPLSAPPPLVDVTRRIAPLVEQLISGRESAGRKRPAEQVPNSGNPCVAATAIPSQAPRRKPAGRCRGQRVPAYSPVTAQGDGMVRTANPLRRGGEKNDHLMAMKDVIDPAGDDLEIISGFCDERRVGTVEQYLQLRLSSAKGCCVGP